MLTSPDVCTWPLSTLVTRVIGTKTRLRPSTSTTRPRTRGWRPSVRRVTTTSRTLPTWSPRGSKIGNPTRRATKTREGEVLTGPPYRGRGGRGSGSEDVEAEVRVHPAARDRGQGQRGGREVGDGADVDRGATRRHLLALARAGVRRVEAVERARLRDARSPDHHRYAVPEGRG